MPTRLYKTTNKKPILRWRWLFGVDQIANYTDYNAADVMDWIFYWIDCPIQKLDGSIWIVRKKDIKKFIKSKKPPKTEILKPRIYKKPKIKRRRLW